MIKKLESKIFVILMISLSTITIGVVVLFTISNYKNTINTSSFFMDRFLKPEDNNDNRQINDEKPAEIDGFYRIKISSSNEIIDTNQEVDDSIKNIALKASKKNFKSGIIDSYIYKVENNPENEKMVMLAYNEEAVKRIQVLILSAIILLILFELIIYLISLKISEWIVKPVEETFKKQKEFISDASHELKTPLAVIEANTEVLENNVGENKWIKYIQNEITSMDKLINEMLLLAKIENTNSKTNFEKFNLSQEVEIISSMFESMAYEKNVKLETNIENNITFNGDKEDIKHILSTLIDNAIKHTDTKVDVKLHKEKENIFFTVENEGKEIPKDERDKIFERFYRIDKSRNRSEKRYGLGLAIAKSTVQKYNGSIKVECKNGVTSFIVKIPC